MVINIEDNEKEGITHALRVAIGMTCDKLRATFDCCHPDRINLRSYQWIQDNFDVMKELKKLLDRIDEQDEKKGE